jgi:hypothetical protein
MRILEIAIESFLWDDKDGVIEHSTEGMILSLENFIKLYKDETILQLQEALEAVKAMAGSHTIMKDDPHPHPAGMQRIFETANEALAKDKQ